MAGMKASLELILSVGVEAIESRVLTLAARLCEGLRAKGYRIAGSTENGGSSAIVSFTRHGLDTAELSASLKRRQIYHHVIHQRIRFSPHLYNNQEDVAAALAAV
jgi:selenocysteine lyase/cysteine desulfurase